MLNIPDRWVILKVESPDELTYKVFGSWKGGYTSSDSWQLNSGIASVLETEKSYEFTGYSGSVYICSKTSYGATAFGQAILNDFMRIYKDNDQGIVLTLMLEEEIPALVKTFPLTTK